MTRECPKKTPTLAAVATIPTTPTPRVNEIVELEADTDTDSGKAHA
jgi:hypothetical protein